MARSSQNDEGKPFERITPITPDAAQRRTAANEPPEDKRSRAWLLPLAFTVLVAALVFVLFWLPERLPAPDTRTQAPEGQAPAAQTGTINPPALAEPTAGVSLDTEAILKKRQQADSLGKQAREQRDALMDRGLGQWAKSRADTLNQQLAQADSLFSNREFDAARQEYQKALDQAQQLREQAEQLLADSLSRGQKALQAGDDKTALEAFELALTLNPGNTQAERGRRRAANLEEVISRVNKAEAAETRGELEQAKTHFQAALELDEQNDKARAGLARIEKALAERAFTQKMSDGLSALEQQQYGAAQSAFQEALKLKANAPEARDGLAQARLGLQKQRIEMLRSQALRAEQNEHWTEARKLYTKLLDLDASLSFAQQGKARTGRRAQLDARLQGHIDQPSRLSAQSVREAARAVLDQAQAIDNPGPKLQDQVNQLTRLLEEASTPVRVTLYSDGETQVIVYPVSQIGDLGQFDTKSLNLTPGQYTAIGRRPGYRDVRVPFTVTREGIAEPPVIKTEERI